MHERPVTPAQLRAGRGLLGFSQADFAEQAVVLPSLTPSLPDRCQPQRVRNPPSEDAENHGADHYLPIFSTRDRFFTVSEPN
jgi:hypothetical protein